MMEVAQLEQTINQHNIVEVLKTWVYARDQGDWDALANCFHPNATIHISWISDSALAFIAGSKKMLREIKPGEHSKHNLGSSRIRINGNRAVSECHVELLRRICSNETDFDTHTWGRFLDLFEKRKNRNWRIVKRTMVYEKDRLDAVDPSKLPRDFWENLGLCYLEVHAGAGGTEAQDWAQMLQRMYNRWCEKHGYQLEWLEESVGEEAGIKSCTFKVNGLDAYGWLKTESGVHRLVRISPFDASARRHTSFASVWVFPVIDNDIAVELEEKDLRIDTYRASGAEGQHVNKTDSAVRITHIPTGIVVQCQNDRSQHRNRAAAFDMLRARLYEAELQKREEEAQARHDAKTEIGWGYQIRSYVLQPYQLVKDLRTNLETSNIQAVLDGDLDDFMAAALASRIESI